MLALRKRLYGPNLGFNIKVFQVLRFSQVCLLCEKVLWPESGFLALRKGSMVLYPGLKHEKCGKELKRNARPVSSLQKLWVLTQKGTRRNPPSGNPNSGEGVPFFFLFYISVMVLT